MSPATRRVVSLLFAGLLSLVVAVPAFAYNEENVKHIRISRLDAIKCATPIRLVADLTDRNGAAVPGATVLWSFEKSKTGDRLNPTTTSSDIEGRARTTLTLACKKGTRKIRAHVPGDGSATITIVCKSDTSCVKKDDDDDDDDDDDVKTITLTRLDSIRCDRNIRLEAYLRDKDGDPVKGETVKFKLLDKEDGDKLTPKSQKSNNSGKARTNLDLSCHEGSRKVEASSDGKKKTITIRCGNNQGCKIDDDDDDDDDKDKDFIIVPLDRTGGTGPGSPWGPADPRSAGSISPPGAPLSQSVAILLATMVAILVAGLAQHPPRQFAPAGWRRPVTA